jgi:glycosyltransferase involved in cell wall biosynthesis
MKVGIVTQWYPPEPAFIPASLAAELLARGHHVRVLTGFPNYPYGVLYPGHRQRWTHVEVANGVSVRRVPLYPNHDGSGLRRAANYLSYGVSSSVAGVRFLAGADVVYVYLTPATAFMAAAVLRTLDRVPVVIHIQDVWPESVTESSMAPSGRAGRLIDRTLHAAMRAVYRMSAGVAVIAPSMRDLVVSRGADPRTTEVVLNWADEKLFRPVPPSESARRSIGYRDRCTIMYAGTMGPFQNIEASIRAAAAVADVADLVLVGSGVEETAARRLAAGLGAPNVRFLGRRSPIDMASLTGAADFQLVTLRDLPMFRGTIPSKLQAALACESPVIVSVPGDCASLVESHGVGLACPPDDWFALADRFRQAAKLSAGERMEMGLRAGRVYRTLMSRQAGVDRLEEMLTAASGVRR